MSIPILCLANSDVEAVTPVCGWNPSFSSSDRLTWANIFVKARGQGLTIPAAEKVAFMKTYQIQLPGLKWLP
uniref:Uncharacterized protein n=1 Tax=viral metagenome TaxID=1070528 RepID=A0A6C0DFQ5_9ZZZZ